MRTVAPRSYLRSQTCSLVGVVAALAALTVGAMACGILRSGDNSQKPPASKTSLSPSLPLARSEVPGRSPSLAPPESPASLGVAANDVTERYSLQEPDLRLVLPRVLTEVSDVVALSQTEIACVQDEKGVVFVYDLGERAITRRMHFAPGGDFEGLASVGSRLFVLRSDGLLYELSGDWDSPSVKSYSLRIPTSNNEGLCFDQKRERLLIAPKSRLGKGSEFKDTRAVFAFDLRTMELLPEPAFYISVDDIRDFAQSRARPVPEKAKKKGGGKRSALRFMPSAIVVHPRTGELLLLSSVDHVLVACDLNGKVTGYAALDPELFPQPEGLTFLPNGDMVISNEAAGREPTLLLFRYRASQG
jgi:hypothetical protein